MTIHTSRKSKAKIGRNSSRILLHRGSFGKPESTFIKPMDKIQELIASLLNVYYIKETPLTEL
jgi:hypothetical protein